MRFFMGMLVSVLLLGGEPLVHPSDAVQKATAPRVDASRKKPGRFAKLRAFVVESAAFGGDEVAVTRSRPADKRVIRDVKP